MERADLIKRSMELVASISEHFQYFLSHFYQVVLLCTNRCIQSVQQLHFRSQI
jgi:hypothetical protein